MPAIKKAGLVLSERSFIKDDIIPRWKGKEVIIRGRPNEGACGCRLNHNELEEEIARRSARPDYRSLNKDHYHSLTQMVPKYRTLYTTYKIVTSYILFSNFS